MTPKEKAEKLVDNFMWCATTSDQTAPISKEYAKMYALICCDEMLAHLEMVDDDAAIIYWHDVKNEIEKL